MRIRAQHLVQRIFLFATFTSSLVCLPLASSFAAKTPSPATSAVGPFATSTAEYKFEAKIDPEVLAGEATELWARVFWPKQLRSEPHPILFFLHGNHSTCGSGSNPRVDSDCSYTHTGSCPAGMVVTPNHDGYNYIAENLASWGYIVVSINANRGITCGGSADGDSGLNLARGRLVLRHLENWYKWATQGGAPGSLGLPDSAWKGSIDFGNVGLLGHSRGGEGMRAAYNIYRDAGSPWPARIPGLKVKGIFEIGAVDGQTSRVLDADDTAWNQILPMCDGDVSDLEGRLPFERMITKPTEAHKSPKSLYMVWGANHNFFNTEWQESDSWGCSGHDPIYGPGPISEAQKTVGLAAASSFFRAHVGRQTEAALGEHFDPLFSLPSALASVTRIDRDYLRTYDSAFSVRVEDFDQATGINSHSVNNEAVGITVAHEAYELPKRAKIDWQSAGDDNYLQLNWKNSGEGSNVSALSTLDFRVARQSSFADVKVPTDFSVQLVDAAGHLSAKIPASAYAEILGPANENTVVYQTVRVPLADFGTFNLASVRGVRFVFDRSPTGAIYLAHVRFTSGASLQLEMQPQLRVTPLAGQVRPTGTLLSSLRRPQVFKARLVGIKHLASTRFSTNQKPTVDITVHTPAGFPVQDQLPTLVVNGSKKFSMARYGTGGRTDVLIFSIPKADYDKLPISGSMYIQYGRGTPTKVWKLENYDKSSFSL